MAKASLLARLALAFALAVAPLAARAQESAVLALWAQDSGSLPPEYAWQVRVEFLTSGQARATYCKGYAQAEPGCASRQAKVPAAAWSALVAGIEASAPDLLAHPPRPVGQDQMLVGGGSLWGWVLFKGQRIDLPAQPRQADRARTGALLNLLQAATPKGLVDRAARRARQP